MYIIAIIKIVGLVIRIVASPISSLVGTFSQLGIM